MVSKKQKIKIKKRRSIGGVNAQGALKTVFDGQVAAATNASQQRLTYGEVGKQVKQAQGEFGRELWGSIATGKKPDFSKVGETARKRIKGLEKMSERSFEIASKVGIPTSGIKSSLSSATTSVSGLAKSATTAGSTLTKSATASFSSLANGASKELKINSSCVIL